ncbi:MAG: cobyrinate a,c-diamide synthase [Arenicellales bacterium WSBS_2016_MAG_OTU3]
MKKGLIISAPSSGSGKTTLTLALLRYLRNGGKSVQPFKAGPDYIDPTFHRASSGVDCYNLDAWAMPPSGIGGLIDWANDDAICIVEGVMGLFDGAETGNRQDGSTGHLAELTGWPVVLVVDASGMAASAAAVVKGFSEFRDGVNVAGVIFNRVGSLRHAQMLERACAPLGIRVLGSLQRNHLLELPSRHLGLVQAGEHAALETFLETAAQTLAASVDVDAVINLARYSRDIGNDRQMLLAPPGKNIAVARDRAFSFIYPAMIKHWCQSGSVIHYFSPLENEAMNAECDAVFLPGGYPELYAEMLSRNENFKQSLRDAARQNKTIYGECGGYMTLGRKLRDKAGKQHDMVNLLNVDTSFATPRMTLGYREFRPVSKGIYPGGDKLRGHEFHFASIESEDTAQRLFEAVDAAGSRLPPMGHVNGSVVGSFAHLICGAA